MEAATTDDAWAAAHSDLHRALRLRPWQWPAVEYPDAECPYPAGCAAAKNWQRRRDERPEAFALYRALRDAAAQSKREVEAAARKR